MRRKKAFEKYFDNLDDTFEYVKRVKDINGDTVQVEISDLAVGNVWYVIVWKVK